MKGNLFLWPAWAKGKCTVYEWIINKIPLTICFYYVYISPDTQQQMWFDNALSTGASLVEPKVCGSVMGLNAISPDLKM